LALGGAFLLGSLRHRVSEIWYKGVQLETFYLILATMFYLVPPDADRVPTGSR
jgi:Ca2+/H+ antiporter